MTQQMGALQADLHDQGEMTQHKLRKTENLFKKSATTEDLSRGREESHARGAGGVALATAVSEMICWSNSPPVDEGTKGLPGSTDRTLDDELDKENSEDFHMEDDVLRRPRTSSKELKSFTDSKGSVSRWSKGVDDDRGGRSRSAPPPKRKPSQSEEVMAAATGSKELAALEHQAQEVERDIQNLKSKLATDSGTKKAERRKDVKILTEILADIRGHEAQIKREIGVATGTAREVKESRLQRASEKRWKEIKREMELNV